MLLPFTFLLFFCFFFVICFVYFFFFFFNDTATTEIYTLSLHDALPISTGGNAKIQIYNSIGQLVWLNEISNISAGLQKVVWNGVDNYGQKVSSGNYIYRVVFTDFSGKSFYKSDKMTLLK